MRGVRQIGVIFMVLMLVLASVGIGYASWSKTLTITGTVTTGSVDAEYIEASETYVYKDIVTGDMVVLGEPSTNPDYMLIGSAVCETTVPGDTEPVEDVVVTFDGLFPCVDFVVDLNWHYIGTVPAKVQTITWNIPANLQGSTTINMYRCDENCVPILDENDEKIPVVVGTQLHYCDYVRIDIIIHLEQDDALMNLSELPISGSIYMVQWNEFVAP